MKPRPCRAGASLRKTFDLTRKVTAMKTLLAIIAIVISVGRADAATIHISGQFSSFSGHVYTCAGGCEQPWITVSQFTALMPAHLDASLRFFGSDQQGSTASVLGQFLISAVGSFTDDQNWTVSFHQSSAGPVYQTDLTISNVAGIVVATLFQAAQPGLVGFDGYSGNFTLFNSAGSIAPLATPLPGALFMFAPSLIALWLAAKRKSVTSH